MTTENSTIEILAARAEIYEVIVKSCRGLDRGDIAMAASVYHPDGVDERQGGLRTGLEFATYSVNRHLKDHLANTHHITSFYVEVDGDKAVAESYVLVTMRFERDGKLFDVTGSGRYLDRFERRDGCWKISHRLSIGDWSRIDEVRERLDTDPSQMIVNGTRDRLDPSYNYFLE